jgi:TM2 domain-containing membrane protein YozV
MSAALPGVGQIYNGQMTKGIICLAVYLPALLVLLFAPNASAFFGQVFTILGGGIPRAGSTLSPGLSLLLLVAAVVWMYAVVDAPMIASKQNKDGGPGAPKIDKTGWEV